MSRFLIAWECGEGLGHVIPIAQVARELISRGHKVDVVLADMSSARSAFGDLVEHPALTLWQAPTWRLSLVGSRSPVSLVELLFQLGYLDARRLSMLVRGWLSIMKAAAPDVILAEHAPTALLAARIVGAPAAVFGSGFFIPPETQPIPPFAEWVLFDRDRLVEGEGLFVGVCNAVLAEYGAVPITAASDLWSVGRRLLTTLPVLDHYGRYRNGDCEYVGFSAPPAVGCAPSWPEGQSFRVCVYLKAGYAHALEVLKALVVLSLPTVAFVPGILPSDQRSLSCPTLHLSEQPLDLASVAEACDLFITNGGAGVTGVAVRAGVPLLVLPMQAEQLITARRIVKLKVGLALLEDEVAGDAAAAVQRIRTESHFRENARRLMEHELLSAGADASQRIANAVEALVRVATLEVR